MSLTSVDLPDPLTPVTAVSSAERNPDVDVLQVVLARAADDELALERAAGAPPASESSARRSDTRRSATTARRPAAARPSAAAACPGKSRGRRDRRRRAEVDHVVGHADRLFVVLDDDHGVAEIAQARERASSLRLSRWCRPIDGSSSTYSTPVEVRADLRREADALPFAARQRRRAAAEREIADADIVAGSAAAPGFLSGSARR